MSVFLCLMKGENDDALTWPIRYKGTITLNNQLKDEGHHTQSIICYMEVVSCKNYGHGRGMLCFISHEELDMQEMKICQCLKDGSLYFRVQVEAIPAAVKPWLVPSAPSTPDVKNNV